LKAHRLMYHSTLAWRVIKKKRFRVYRTRGHALPPPPLVALDDSLLLGTALGLPPVVPPLYRAHLSRYRI